jgi:hypothetical protein
MSDFIFNPKKNEANPLDEFYSFIDNSSFIDEKNNPRVEENSEHVLAKKIYRSDSSYRLMIKVNTDHKPYNPISTYGKEKSSSFLDAIARSDKFIQVNQKAFDYYIKFLKSKNVSWLNNTEREI